VVLAFQWDKQNSAICSESFSRIPELKEYHQLEGVSKSIGSNGVGLEWWRCRDLNPGLHLFIAVIPHSYLPDFAVTDDLLTMALIGAFRRT
jgi:hypothetical protein